MFTSEHSICRLQYLLCQWHLRNRLTFKRFRKDAPHLVGRDDYLPVKSLVDDQILCGSNGKTRCANMFSACSGDNEVALVVEDLFDEFTALVDPLLAQRPSVFH